MASTTKRKDTRRDTDVGGEREITSAENGLYVGEKYTRTNEPAVSADRRTGWHTPWVSLRSGLNRRKARDCGFLIDRETAFIGFTVIFRVLHPVYL